MGKNIDDGSTERYLVSTEVRIYIGWIDELMDEYIKGRMNEWMNGWKDERMNKWMNKVFKTCMLGLNPSL